MGRLMGVGVLLAALGAPARAQTVPALPTPGAFLPRYSCGTTRARRWTRSTPT